MRLIIMIKTMIEIMQIIIIITMIGIMQIIIIINMIGIMQITSIHADCTCLVGLDTRN